jgi:hypothetical protein
MQEHRPIFRGASIFSLFLLILFPAAQAQAIFVEYTGRAAFNATVPWVFVENWDSFASGTSFANGSCVNDITYEYVPDIPPYSRKNVDFQVTNAYGYTTRANTLGLTGDDSPGNERYFTYDGIKFHFLTPIRSFGIDISTEAPNAGYFQATTSLGVALSVLDPLPGLTTGQFVGFTSDVPISWVSIAYNPNFPVDQDGYVYGWALDTLRYIPLPPSLLLLGSGLAGLGLWRLRQRFKV